MNLLKDSWSDNFAPNYTLVTSSIVKAEGKKIIFFIVLKSKDAFKTDLRKGTGLTAEYRWLQMDMQALPG